MPTTTFAGLTFERPRIMGIVNVTPDSFSDGGETVTEDAAVARGLAMLADGADILDVGGESTRPGAAAVSQDEELNRVLPVVERLVGEGAVVSIDTRHGAVIAAAVAAGAAIINDVTALEGDPESLAIAAESGAHVILMHMRGEPATMQNAPSYRDVVAQVRDYLAARVEACEAAGIGKGHIAVDPGIGFGKTVEHNLALIANLNRFGDLGCPLVLGASRKS
ncbi:MAG: dihydropteroate synthase, partial [Rhodospirillales bacterium]|nr:dihydropteroate synthase [Rhodospirillales bacterium]